MVFDYGLIDFGLSPLESFGINTSRLVSTIIIVFLIFFVVFLVIFPLSSYVPLNIAGLNFLNKIFIFSNPFKRGSINL